MISLRDHLERALERITGPFLQSVLFQKLLTAFMSELQEVEQANIDLLTVRLLENATGFWLDVWGRIVQEPRRGRDDDIYKQFILAAILRNTSDGTPNRLLDTLRTITGSAHLREVYPHVVELDYDGTFDAAPLELREFLQKAAPADVWVWPVVERGDTPFMLGDIADATLGSDLDDLDDLGDADLLTEIV